MGVTEVPQLRAVAAQTPEEELARCGAGGEAQTWGRYPMSTSMLLLSLAPYSHSMSTFRDLQGSPASARAAANPNKWEHPRASGELCAPSTSPDPCWSRAQHPLGTQHL